MKTNKMLLGGVCAALCLTLTGCGDGKMKLKKDTFTVEFGNKASLKPAHYVEADKDVLKDAKVTIKNKKYYKGHGEDDSDYYKRKQILKPGTYKGVVSYGDEKDEFTLKVKDTKAPECFDSEVELPNTATKEDLESIILSEHCFDKFGDITNDGEDLTLKKVRGKYDLKKEGVYNLKYQAVDAAGNKSKKFEVKLTVVKAIKSVTIQGPKDDETGLSVQFRFDFNKKGDMNKSTFILKADKGSKAYDIPQSDFETVANNIFEDAEEDMGLESGNKKYTKNANEAVYTYETTPNKYQSVNYKDVMEVIDELDTTSKPVIEYYK